VTRKKAPRRGTHHCGELLGAPVVLLGLTGQVFADLAHVLQLVPPARSHMQVNRNQPVLNYHSPNCHTLHTTSTHTVAATIRHAERHQEHSPVQHVVDSLAHDAVDALQVVVQLLHVAAAVGVQIIPPLALDHSVYRTTNTFRIWVISIPLCLHLTTVCAYQT
jgi:hypothetical protein